MPRTNNPDDWNFEAVLKIVIIRANFAMTNRMEQRYVRLTLNNALMNAKNSIYSELYSRPSIDAPSLN